MSGLAFAEVELGVAALPRTAGRRALALLAMGLGLGRTPVRPVVRDVSFTIEPGEAVALVGRDAAAAGLVLAAAAGWVEPARGRIVWDELPASFVEPRAGFHQDLSVRDNLLARAQGRRVRGVDPSSVIDQVVDLTGSSAVLDRRAGSLDRRSAARVAFAAAVSLGGSTVVWDDRLLAADPVFRQRCYGMIPDLVASGRSVLMAGAARGKVAELATRALWIDDGTLRLDGRPRDVLLDHLLRPLVRTAEPEPPGSWPVRLVDIRLLDDLAAPLSVVAAGRPLVVSIDLEVDGRIERPHVVLGVADASGPVTGASTFLRGGGPEALEGRCRLECRFVDLPLAPHREVSFRLALYAEDGFTILRPKGVVATAVTGGPVPDALRVADRPSTRVVGAPPVLAEYEWRTTVLDPPPPLGHADTP